MLADSYGRVATDLRVSLTDRCNLRCEYCMPAEGLDWLPRPTLLTDDEVVRLVRIGVELLGITEIRFTGGEPLLRRGLPASSPVPRRCGPGRDLADDQRHRPGPARRAAREAGLDRINVSLDTLRPAVFRELAGATASATCWPGSPARRPPGSLRSRSTPCSCAAVNDDEAVPLLRFCLERAYQLRFIEQMPLDAQHGWRRENMVTAEEILESLSAEFSLTPDDARPRGAAPAETFLVNGGPARVGVIGSVTRPFCGACDRVRLTADGQVRNCLFAREESNLRDPMRAGASDRGACRVVAAGGGGQTAWAWDQRARVSAARPADVRHRRLTSPSCFLAVLEEDGRPGRHSARGPARSLWLSRDLSLIATSLSPELALAFRMFPIYR